MLLFFSTIHYHHVPCLCLKNIKQKCVYLSTADIDALNHRIIETIHDFSCTLTSTSTTAKTELGRECLDLIFFLPSKGVSGVSQKKTPKIPQPKIPQKKHIRRILCYVFTKKNTPKRATRKEFSAIFFFAVHWPVGGPWLSVATPEGGGPRFGGPRCTYRKLQAE